MGSWVFVVLIVLVLQMGVLVWTLGRLAFGLKLRDDACAACRDRVIIAFENHAAHSTQALENNAAAMRELKAAIVKLIEDK